MIYSGRASIDGETPVVRPVVAPAAAAPVAKPTPDIQSANIREDRSSRPNPAVNNANNREDRVVERPAFNAPAPKPVSSSSAPDRSDWNTKIKVSQDTIDQVKKEGPTMAGRSSNSLAASPQWKEAVHRIYPGVAKEGGTGEGSSSVKPVITKPKSDDAPSSGIPKILGVGGSGTNAWPQENRPSAPVTPPTVKSEITPSVNPTRKPSAGGGLGKPTKSTTTPPSGIAALPGTSHSLELPEPTPTPSNSSKSGVNPFPPLLGNGM